MNRIFNFDNSMLYAIDYVNTMNNILEYIATDLNFDLDMYEKSLQIIDCDETINQLSAIYSLIVCDNALSVAKTQKYIITTDNLDSESLIQINVISDNNNDIIRYTYDRVINRLERKCVLREKYI